MEDIPNLHCPAHPQQQLQQQQQSPQPLLEQPLTTTTTTTATTTALPVLENICEQTSNSPAPARASPLLEMPGKFTKTHAAPSSQVPFSSSDSCNRKPTSRPTSSNFVYYMSSFRSAALLDDRLQIPCDKPGKHHCRCADEEDEEVLLQPLPVRANGERKRRRSLPCRPQPAVVESQPAASPSPIPATEPTLLPPLKEPPQPQPSPPRDNNHLLDGLERSFRTQLSIDSDQQDCCGNLEKRYKRSESGSSGSSTTTTTTTTSTSTSTNSASSSYTKDGNNTHVPLLMPWISYSANGNVVANNPSPPTPPGMNLVLNPFCSDRTALAMARAKSLEPHLLQQQKKVKGVADADGRASANGDLNRLMSKLSFSQDTESSPTTGKSAEQLPGILDWISRVPGRVLGADQESQHTTSPNHQQQQQQAPTKVRNCNLALSAREFDEVLAVLRARTPLGRRRTALRTAKRREKYDKLVNEQQQQQTTTTCGRVTVADNVSNKADVLLGAILRTTSKENASARKGLADISNGTRPRMPSKEDTTASEKTAATTTSSCPESTGNGVTPLDGCDTSLPSALNKRLSRLTRLFKRQDQDKLTTSKDNDCLSPSPSPQRTNHSQRDSRVKRRIDFSSEQAEVDGADEEEAENDEEEEDDEEDEEDEEEEEEEDDEDEVDESHCDSSVGTSTNSAHLNSIFHSTNYEKRNSCCSPDQPQKLKAEGQRQRTECCTNGRTITATTGKKKSRGKRDLSPIWVNHNNNHVSSNDSNVNGIETATEFQPDDSETIDRTLVPSAKEQERFRRSLENAASMVFHSRTGLPLTSSPAPLRRGSCCFDFDSSLNSVSSKRRYLFDFNIYRTRRVTDELSNCRLCLFSALFELNTPPSPGAVSLEEGDRETESACDIEEVTRRRSTSRNRPQSHALLGSFEESALNGRLEPVSTVHGFTAEIGASGSFCPKHRKLPVTVFFYTLGDNDKVSSPYLVSNRIILRT